MNSIEARTRIQSILNVSADGVFGPKTQAAFSKLATASPDEQWLNANSPAEKTVHEVTASSFADPADIIAFQKAKARGLSDDEAFKVGDNGIGKWGGDTKKGSGPAVALPPEDWKPFGKNPSGKKVLVKANGREVVAELRDTMPSKANITNGCLIDLNPDACEALDLSPPVKIHCTWQWV